MSATNLARLANFYIIPTQTLKIQKLATSLPSGYVKIAIENGHRNSEFSH